MVRTSPGACFDLQWPIAELRTGTAPKRVKRPTVAGARVLVVEDDAAVRSLVELALEARGAEPTVVASRQEFDAALDKGQEFDAALVDLSPLASDANGALQRLRLGNPGIPVILISGVASGVPEDLVSEVTPGSESRSRWAKCSPSWLLSSRRARASEYQHRARAFMGGSRTGG